MTAVLDASAAVIVGLRQPGWRAAERVLSAASEVVAPGLLIAEATNTLWRYVASANLSVAEARRALPACLALVDEFVDQAALAADALELAVVNRHPAHDMFYLALARQRSALLLTFDKKLTVLASKAGVPYART